MEKTRRQKHFMEVFYWKQSLKQTMMMCSFFLCKFEDLYGIVFLFDFGKSVLNRTQGLFWFGLVHSDSTFQWSVSIFFFIQSSGVWGFVPQRWKFLYVFFGICDRVLSRVCHEEMSNRTNGFDVPPGFKLKDWWSNFFPKKNFFFPLSLLGLSQRVEQKLQAETAIFHLTLLCCDRFCRQSFQNFCNRRHKVKENNF